MKNFSSSCPSRHADFLSAGTPAQCLHIQGALWISHRILGPQKKPRPRKVMGLAQGRTMATNRLPVSRFSVKLILVICNWVLIHLWRTGQGDDRTGHPPVLRYKSLGLSTEQFVRGWLRANSGVKRSTTFYFPNALLLSCHSVSVIIGASFPILPPYGWTKFLSASYTPKAFPFPW